MIYCLFKPKRNLPSNREGYLHRWQKYVSNEAIEGTTYFLAESKAFIVGKQKHLLGLSLYLSPKPKAWAEAEPNPNTT